MSLVSNKSEPDSLARGQLFADIASNSPLRRLGAAAETALIVRSVRKVLVDSERDYVSQIAATFQEFDLIRTIEILTQVFGDIHENAGDLASLRVQRSVVRILAEIASAQVVALLISMTENKNVAFQASHALQKILDENASAVSPDNLLAITQLGNNKVSQIQYSWNSQCQTEQREGEYAVDCSQVIQLARQELIQRGLTA